MIGSTTRQIDIDAGRDNAAGNITNTNSNNTYEIVMAGDGSPIAAWMASLAEEIRTDKYVSEFVDTLQMYTQRLTHDGIDGLEAKLKHAGRASDVSLAFRKKELFTRLLARYSMFDSAQQIFAYLLSKVEQDFRAYVMPHLGSYTDADVDRLFAEYVISPCATEIKSGVFCLNSAIAAGMVYWLAEQCYIRWHR
ncbi:hypothetical protein G6L37_22470 [Agrobacterium rubi]|uniref:ABC-three component system protein n=1 Tax=Agrobacterium rubi TaxID=28099 RepID=UPI0015747436|nr:ABC-three component system protein [Agrobacterium rubi]NTF08898.1 hypothetical protein [Agrobacterium rubi]NTF21169.1 hypothetical protein [Agrobacterium rubi]NTF28026.1 hypothetical protein [Agrobacterium rubi]